MLTIKREALVDVLSTVAPALSDNNLLPAMTHFCFGGETLTAFNDHIGIIAPFKTEFRGAVPSSLLDILRQSNAKNVDMEEEDGILYVTAKPSNLKLPVLSADQFEGYYKLNEPAASDFISCDMQQFIEGVETCLRSVGNDTGVPDQLGVTILTGGSKKVELFSTNDATVARAIVTVKQKPDFERVIMPTEFCKEFIRLADKSSKVAIVDDHVLMINKDQIRLFGALVHSDVPMDYHDIMKRHLSDDMISNMVEVPTKALGLAVARALLVIDADQIATEVEVSKSTKGDYKNLKFNTTSAKGEVRDSLKIGMTQPDVKVTIEPRLLKYAPEYERMIITERCFIMEKGNSLLFAAVHERK